MATYTTRLGLYKPAANGSENVNVVTDLNDNWDRVDAMVSFVPVTTGTYPASAYRGESFYETDTGKGYINTSAVASTITKAQVLVAGANFDSNITLSSSAGQFTTGGTTSDSTFAAQRAAASDFLISGRTIATSASSMFTVQVNGQLDWGPGSTARDTNLYRASANVLATDDSFTVGGSLTVTASANLDDTLVGGNLIIGAATYRNKLSTPVTVANTTTETTVATLTIPANDATTGAVYRIKALGLGSVTGTPTMTYRARLGGSGGTQLASSGAVTSSSGITSHTWEADLYFVCLSTGASGTSRGILCVREALSVAGSAPFTVINRQDGTSSVTFDTTASKDLVITVQWSAASSSNTITAHIVSCERVA